MSAMAIGLAIGLLAGAVGGAALVRYGLGLGERMAWGGREGHPALSEYDPPLVQSHTDGTEDDELEVEP